MFQEFESSVDPRLSSGGINLPGDAKNGGKITLGWCIMIIIETAAALAGFDLTHDYTNYKDDFRGLNSMAIGSQSAFFY